LELLIVIFCDGAGSRLGRVLRPSTARAGGRGSARDVPSAIEPRRDLQHSLGVGLGFATLNILSLGARRFEEEEAGLNFGEILAILVVVLSIVLLGWEMLYVFHILPIRLTPR